MARGTGGACAATARSPGGRAGPPLGQRHPTHRPDQGHQLLPAGGRRRSCALAPADALRYYAQALDLYPRATDPDPASGLDLAIGLGTAQRQTGDPAFRDTLLGAARRAADLGDTERLVAAALANNRGFFSAAGAIDTDKVEILEMALDRLSADNADRALVLATLCAELAHGSPLERRQALADEALAIAESSGDDAIIVRVLNHVFIPLQVPPLLEQRWPGRPTPWFEPSGSVTRCCSSGRPVASRRPPPAPGISTRWTVASRSGDRWRNS